MESLIAEAGGAEGECLARIVAIIATKTRAGNVENSFAYDNIQYVVSKLRQKVKDGKFDLFMDILAMLCEEGDLTTDALNEFLADNKIGYIAIRMMRPQGIAWKKVGNDANNTEDEAVEASENSTILLLNDAEVVKSKEGLKEAKKEWKRSNNELVGIPSSYRIEPQMQ